MPFAKARPRAPMTIAFMLAALMAATADAADPPVTVGEVGTRVVRRDVDLAQIVRKAFEREIRALSVATPRQTYVLSASLVRLDAGMPGAPRTECMVSAVLREKKSGAIRAMIEGKARADGTASTEAAIGTVEAAVHGAATALPQALR
jgi:hypothetical protein